MTNRKSNKPQHAAAGSWAEPSLFGNEQHDLFERDAAKSSSVENQKAMAD